MKKTLALLLALAAAPAFAADHSMGGHGGMDMKGHDMGAKGAKAELKGVEVRKAKVDGYDFTYRLIDMKDEMAGMKNMDMSKMKSHHLMVFVTAPDGKAVENAKVGFKVVGPDGAEQKVMAQAMLGGYGADVDVKAKGGYKVTAKTMAGEKTLVDEFTYTAK